MPPSPYKPPLDSNLPPPLSLATRPLNGAIDRARILRSNQSPPEGILWQHLRARRLDSLKFRRQHPLGPYAADFYCHEAGLIIEIDGKEHASPERRLTDRARDDWMRERGIEVFRIGAPAIAVNLDAVLVQIRRVCRSRIEQVKEQRRATQL